MIRRIAREYRTLRWLGFSRRSALRWAIQNAWLGVDGP